ncbi:diguanylate cyclase [Clostridiaceae bacterium HSG29]|nr:diguanylate cyclase [Clostridiaceae bacterium HSG29]
MENEYISTVLIVDDTEANLIALSALLESEDVNVLQARSGNEALKIILTNKIDIILLDVQMPDMDGFEVAEILRGNNKTKTIPIIFITAISKEEEYIFKGYELGAVDYLYKPIRNELLKSKIKVFLRLNKQAKIIEEKNSKLEMIINELKEKKDEISRLARLDGLTGVFNRRVFDENFGNEWARCFRNKKYLSVIMIDIDFFKQYNDTYGHLVGDDALILVAKEIVKTVGRSYDEVFRYGGEEFVVLLPNTDYQGAIFIAENIRKNIEKLEIEHRNSEIAKYLTVSLGISTCVPSDNIEKMTLLDIADNMLYDAKRSGRNRTTGKNLDKLMNNI